MWGCLGALQWGQRPEAAVTGTCSAAMRLFGMLSGCCCLRSRITCCACSWNTMKGEGKVAGAHRVQGAGMGGWPAVSEGSLMAAQEVQHDSVLQWQHIIAVSGTSAVRRECRRQAPPGLLCSKKRSALDPCPWRPPLVQKAPGALPRPPTCSSRSACTSHLPRASTRSGCAPRRASTLCFVVAAMASSTASCTLTLCSRRARDTTAPAVPQEQ